MRHILLCGTGLRSAEQLVGFGGAEGSLRREEAGGTYESGRGLEQEHPRWGRTEDLFDQRGRPTPYWGAAGVGAQNAPPVAPRSPPLHDRDRLCAASLKLT